MVLLLNFALGGKFRYHFAGNTVPVVHFLLLDCLFSGSTIGLKECSGSWHYWLLVVRGCKFEAIMVITFSSIREYFYSKLYLAAVDLILTNVLCQST